VLSGSLDIRLEAISTLLREDGLKPRIGLMRGRGCELSVEDRDDFGCAGLGGVWSWLPVVGGIAIDCAAIQSLVWVSGLKDLCVIIAGGGRPSSQNSCARPFLECEAGILAFGGLVAVAIAVVWSGSKLLVLAGKSLVQLNVCALSCRGNGRRFASEVATAILFADWVRACSLGLSFDSTAGV
jgi:hypothetical protein